MNTQEWERTKKQKRTESRQSQTTGQQPIMKRLTRGNRFSLLQTEFEEPETTTEENETGKTDTNVEATGSETAENEGAKATNEQARKQSDAADSGEIPKNGNSPEKASASSGVTPSDPQTTTTTTETRKED